jgi:transcriptional regulator with XRE-family HTH domain
MPPEQSKLVEVVRRRIRELRRARGLTQEELCESAGISIDAISRIEGGSRAPTLPTLERIARALQISPAAFFEVVEPPPETAQPVRLRRLVSVLERHPENVLVLAEDVVNAVVRAYRSSTAIEKTSSVRAARAARPRRRKR